MSTITVSDIPLDARQPGPAPAPHRRGRARQPSLVGRPPDASPPSRRKKSASAYGADARFLTAGKKIIDTAPRGVPPAHRRSRTRHRQLLARPHPALHRARRAADPPVRHRGVRPHAWKASARI